jgi:hypothetical protein
MSAGVGNDGMSARDAYIQLICDVAHTARGHTVEVSTTEESTACDLNGERGTLQPDGSGYLTCQVTRRVGPSRSSETVSGGDS